MLVSGRDADRDLIAEVLDERLVRPFGAEHAGVPTSMLRIVRVHQLEARDARRRPDHRSELESRQESAARVVGSPQPEQRRRSRSTIGASSSQNFVIAAALTPRTPAKAEQYGTLRGVPMTSPGQQRLYRRWEWNLYSSARWNLVPEGLSQQRFEQSTRHAALSPYCRRRPWGAGFAEAGIQRSTHCSQLGERLTATDERPPATLRLTTGSG